MRVLLLFSIAVLFSACAKDNETNCGKLKEAAFSNNIDEVNAIITNYIERLPSKTYNQPNIRLLAQRISSCNLSSSLQCFDCIETLPSQTEISLDFTYNGVAVHKMIDLSYSPDKRLVFRNIHD